MLPVFNLWIIYYLILLYSYCSFIAPQFATLSPQPYARSHIWHLFRLLPLSIYINNKIYSYSTYNDNSRHNCGIINFLFITRAAMFSSERVLRPLYNWIINIPFKMNFRNIISYQASFCLSPNSCVSVGDATGRAPYGEHN